MFDIISAVGMLTECFWVHDVVRIEQHSSANKMVYGKNLTENGQRRVVLLIGRVPH